VEVLTWRGLVTYYVLFFIHLESRRIDIAGLTVHPNERWMQQMARNVTMDGCGALRDCRYLLHDRDAKYSASFCSIIETARVRTLALPARSSKIIFVGECRRAVDEYVAHYHSERNHQGKSNVLLFPRITETRREGPVRCREQLGGLLRYYHQDAA
jgi:putative transposase